MAEKKKINPTPVIPEVVEIQKEESYTKAEWEAVLKARWQEKMNQVLRGFGLIAIILFYLMTVEFLFETSVFGLIFTPKEFNAFWYFVRHTGEIYGSITAETEFGAALIEKYAWATTISGEATIFDDWLQWGTWFPVAFTTVLEILITVGVAYIVVYSLRDVFGIIKNLVRGTKGTLVELGTAVKTNFDEELREDYTKTKPAKVKKTKVKKEKPADEFKKNVENVIDTLNVDTLDDKTLDELLSYPHTAEEEKIVDSINNSSASAPRNRLVDRD